jgi:hypothetical protein
LPWYAWTIKQILVTLIVLIAMAVIFQTLLRYHYVQAGKATWRIDRLTQQACRVDILPVVCTAPLPLFARPIPAATDRATPADGLALGWGGHRGLSA